jgi:hypothetical protein
MVVGMEAVARMAGMEAAARMAGMEVGLGADPTLGATHERGWTQLDGGDGGGGMVVPGLHYRLKD